MNNAQQVNPHLGCANFFKETNKRRKTDSGGGWVAVAQEAGDQGAKSRSSTDSADLDLPAKSESPAT